MNDRFGQYFYAPDAEADWHRFDPAESKHIFKVLRKRRGDALRLTDGKGRVMDAVIEHIDKNRVDVRIVERRRMPPPAKQLDVFIGPPKSSERFEFFLEKAVELGVRSITPLLSRYTQRFRWNPVRYRRIMIQALKQSKRVYLPQLNDPVRIQEILPLEVPAYAALCEAEEFYTAEYAARQEAAVLIGPEGGFSEEEKELFRSRGVKPVRLSYHRLRTETAGLAAVCLFHAPEILNQKP